MLVYVLLRSGDYKPRVICDTLVECYKYLPDDAKLMQASQKGSEIERYTSRRGNFSIYEYQLLQNRETISDEKS